MSSFPKNPSTRSTRPGKMGGGQHITNEQLAQCKTLWLAGSSSGTLAAQIGVCAQAIRYHISKWKKEIQAESGSASTSQAVASLRAAPRQWRAELQKRLNIPPKSPEAKALVEFLIKVELGLQPNASAEALGWTTELADFKRAYPGLDIVIKMAIQKFHENVLRAIRHAGRNDSRVGMWLLERNKVIREDYRETAKEHVVRIENAYERGRAEIGGPIIEAEVITLPRAG